MKKFVVGMFAVFLGVLVLDAAVGSGRRGDTGLLGSITEMMFSFSDVVTANRSTVKHGLAQKLSGDSAQFEDGTGVWRQLSLESFSDVANDRAFAYVDASGSPRLVWAPIYKKAGLNQDVEQPSGLFFGGGLYADSARGIVNSNVLANKLLYNNANQKQAAVTIGANLSFAAGTLSATASGGNVTATPRTDQIGRVAVFMDDAGTDIASPTNGSSNLKWDGTQLGHNDFNIWAADIVADSLTVNTLTVNGQAFSGMSAGTYTPTITVVANSPATVADYVTHWTRISDLVTVSGRLNLSIAVSGVLTQARISLPTASDFVNTQDCNGQGTRITPNGTINSQMSIIGDVANNEALVQFLPAGASGASGDYTFSFTYIVQ